MSISSDFLFTFPSVSLPPAVCPDRRPPATLLQLEIGTCLATGKAYRQFFCESYKMSYLIYSLRSAMDTPAVPVLALIFVVHTLREVQCDTCNACVCILWISDNYSFMCASECFDFCRHCVYILDWTSGPCVHQGQLALIVNCFDQDWLRYFMQGGRTSENVV